MKISQFYFLFFLIVSGAANSQDTRLTANIWYLTEFQLIGQPSILMSQAEFILGSSQLFFIDEGTAYSVYTNVCDGEAGVALVTYPSSSSQSFFLTPMAFLSGPCSNYTGSYSINPTRYINSYYQAIWSQFNTQVNYSVNQTGALISLRLDFVDGSWAIYHNQVLSNTRVNDLNQVELARNPVEDVIYLNGTEPYDNMNLTLFDLTGKEVQSHSNYQIEKGLRVNQVNPGLYLLVVKTEVGKKVLKVAIR